MTAYEKKEKRKAAKMTFSKRSKISESSYSWEHCVLQFRFFFFFLFDGSLVLVLFLSVPCQSQQVYVVNHPQLS